MARHTKELSQAACLGPMLQPGLNCHPAARPSQIPTVLSQGNLRSAIQPSRLCAPIRAAPDTAALEEEVSDIIKRPPSWLAGNIQLDPDAEKQAIRELQVQA